jgi:hypothetical protein
MDENEMPAPPRNFSNIERARLVFAILFGAVFGISCMSFSIERNASDPVTDSRPTLSQSENVTVSYSPEGQKIYYARPYNSPPNLVCEAGLGGIENDKLEILEQKPDYFIVRVRNTPSLRIHWTAKGIAAPAPSPPGQAAIPGVVELLPAQDPKENTLPSPEPAKQKAPSAPPEPIEIPTTPPEGR